MEEEGKLTKLSPRLWRGVCGRIFPAALRSAEGKRRYALHLSAATASGWRRPAVTSRYAFILGKKKNHLPLPCGGPVSQDSLLLYMPVAFTSARGLLMPFYSLHSGLASYVLSSSLQLQPSAAWHACAWQASATLKEPCACDAPHLRYARCLLPLFNSDGAVTFSCY